VFLLSPEALESPWVSQELEYAVSKDLRQRAITIVPVKIRPCRVPAFLASWTVIDATKNFDRAVQSLASLLEVAPLVQFDQLEPRVFEDFVGNLLKAYGFKKVKPALPSRDMGFDFAAETLQRDPFGRLETVDWLIEVKATKQQADTSSLRAFLGALSLRKERGLFITSGQLTTPAKEWLEDMGRKSGPKISVIEGTELKRLAISKPKVVHKYFKRAEEKQ
jgi:restriction endonuclease Mrr